MRVHCRDETARNPSTLAFLIGQTPEAIEMDQHGVPSRQMLLLVRFIGPPVVPRKKPWPWMGPLPVADIAPFPLCTTLSNVFVAHGPGFRPFSPFDHRRSFFAIFVLETLSLPLRLRLRRRLLFVDTPTRASPEAPVTSTFALRASVV